MILKNEKPERQQQIIGRIWTNLKVEPGTVSAELLKEWAEALAEFDMKAIERAVHYWKAKGCTCPADQFAESCRTLKPERASKMTVANEMEKMMAGLGGDDGKTFEQHYNFLGMNRRMGELPKHRLEQLAKEGLT